MNNLHWSFVNWIRLSLVKCTLGNTPNDSITKLDVYNSLKKRLFLISILIFILNNCFSQVNNEQQALSNKIGIGGWNFGGNTFLINASFDKIKNNNSELSLHSYFISHNNTKDISSSVAFYWAVIKRKSRFNFHFGPELNINYRWYPKYNSNQYVSRYGYFICLGLIPSLKLSNRFSFALEFTFGHGYQWAKNDESFYQQYYFYSERGWYFRTFSSLKLFYYF